MAAPVKRNLPERPPRARGLVRFPGSTFLRGRAAEYSLEMRDADEIKKQVSAVRDRGKELSGFWIGEGAAMGSALEWVLEKRETSPPGELGRAGGESEKIAANLTKLVEKAMAAGPRPVRAKPQPGKKRS